MTLSKQLFMLKIGLLTIVFIGSFFVLSHNSRTYIEAQLSSHAHDAATSLGLAVSANLHSGDVAMIESMADAMFDSGFYRLIRIEKSDGEVVVERERSINVEGVPEWFVKYIPLQTVEMTSSLMSGWKKIGRVSVASSPGYAYVQLWDNVVDTLMWYIFSALILGAIGLYFFRMIMHPLKQVERQVVAITNRDFVTIDAIPKTIDLRRIVLAMNKMSEKLGEVFGELNAMVDSHCKLSHIDPVTELPNRRYFDNILSRKIESDERFRPGALALVQVNNLQELTNVAGRDFGDRLLKKVANVLLEYTEQNPGATAVYLSGADFALLFEDISIDETKSLAERLSRDLMLIESEGMLGSLDCCHIGVAYYDRSQDASKLMSKADMALRKAVNMQGANSYHLLIDSDVEEAVIFTASEWRNKIQTAVDHDDFILQYQPVKDVNNQTVLHYEVMVMLEEEGEEGERKLLPASVFMPQAEGLGLSGDMDKVVIRAVIDKIVSNNHAQENYAVNLSATTLRVPDFIAWLGKELERLPSGGGALFIEMAEYAVVAMPERVRELKELLARYEGKFGVDHFGQGLYSLIYLKSVKVDYLKLAGMYTKSIDTISDYYVFVEMVARLANSYDIDVIAQSVEKEEVLAMLASLKISGAQGCLLGRPESCV